MKRPVWVLLSTLVFCTAMITIQSQRKVLAQEGSDPETHSKVGPYDIPEYVPPNYQSQIQQVVQNLDAIEQQTLARAKTLPINNGTRLLQIRTLGKLLLYDKNYSVERNTPCTTCHTK